MEKALKRILPCLFALSISCLAYGWESSQKGAITWLSIEAPPGLWEKGYGDAFPADYIFKTLAEAGFTGVEFEVVAGRGPSEAYFNTKVENASRCPRMGKREWLEEALCAADKYGIDMWLTLTPSYKVKGTDIKGLADPRHVKIWTDLVAELGTVYKPRHKSVAGIYLHEFDCAEAPDTHAGEQAKFSAFCKDKFGEGYSGAEMPSGKGGAKWDRRFHLYKNDIMTNFVKAMSSEAAKHGMKSMFCLYPPEMFDSDSAAWGYDVVTIEKAVDAFWVVLQAGYRDLKGAWQDTGISYRGTNVPYHETMAFHGKPVSVFECRLLLFPQVLRNYYSKNKEFTRVNGDICNGFLRKSEKVMQLFTGAANNSKWNGLHREWMDAEPQAKIAVMASSVPLVLRFPTAPGVTYKKVFSSLLDDLKKRYASDVQIIGSEFTLKSENLLKYDLVIIPEEMGVGMDESFLKSLKAYLAKGGKLLAIGTPLTTGSADLEIQTNHMEELFGIRTKDSKPLPGYATLESKSIPVPAKKTWCELRDIDVMPATEIIISDKITGKPVMTRKGNAFYLACGYNEGKTPLLASFIDKMAPQPASLEGDGNFRLSSITKANGALCVALPCETAATATLSVDAGRLGIKGDKLEVRNIITGKTVATVSPGELKNGIKVKTDFDSEPYVLAIGPVSAVERFKGIYPDNKVFADMGKIVIEENPEVAIAIPDKPGVKVGIYQNAYGADAIYGQLQRMPGFNCFYLPRLDAECMGHADVIVIPQAKNDVFFDNASNVIKALVSNGKGLVLTHASAAQAEEMFPGIAGKGKGKIIRVQDESVKMLEPLDAAGLKAGDSFAPGFAFDHYSLTPGKDAKSIAKDSKGENVVIAGKAGKGRVVLFGTLPGAFSTWDDPALKDGKLEGKELQLLVDSIKWLSGDRK